MQHPLKAIEFGGIYIVTADTYTLFTEAGASHTLEGDDISFESGSVIVPIRCERRLTADAAIRVLTPRGVLTTWASDFVRFTRRLR